MALDVDLFEHVREVRAGQPGVTEAAMFGGIAFLVSSHMALDVRVQRSTDDIRTRPPKPRRH